MYRREETLKDTDQQLDMLFYRAKVVQNELGREQGISKTIEEGAAKTHQRRSVVFTTSCSCTSLSLCYISAQGELVDPKGDCRSARSSGDTHINIAYSLGSSVTPTFGIPCILLGEQQQMADT